jgi:SET domain-containing protein
MYAPPPYMEKHTNTENTSTHTHTHTHTHRGGRARYVNHSCEPNCYTRIIHVGGRPKVVLYSKRSIEEGEELRCARSHTNNVCVCVRVLVRVRVRVRVRMRVRVCA